VSVDAGHALRPALSCTPRLFFDRGSIELVSLEFRGDIDGDDYRN